MSATNNCFGTVLPHGVFTPKIHAEAWVAPGATVVGDIEIGVGTGIWYGCVLRADLGETIRVGKNTNIQDGSVIHINSGGFSTRIGDEVTIGHMCLIHGCTLEDGAFIGMKSTLMDGVVVESGAMVAAGSLVPPGKRILKGDIWAGSPAKLWKKVTPELAVMFRETWKAYAGLGRAHADSIRGVYRPTAQAAQ
jgi:carbonic anhydrase/acetyltransferase-like protein (isoleucine patch superfamily)